MKRLIFSIISLTTVLSFSACDPKVKARRDGPVRGPSQDDDSEPSGKKKKRNSDDDEPAKKEKSERSERGDRGDRGDRSERSDRADRRSDPDDAPVTPKRNIPDAPKPSAPEYASKADGKPGYVQSPYDSQHRLIDVRGLPPGTEAECPYTRKTFLVPP